MGNTADSVPVRGLDKSKLADLNSSKDLILMYFK